MRAAWAISRAAVKWATYRISQLVFVECELLPDQSNGKISSAFGSSSSRNNTAIILEPRQQIPALSGIHIEFSNDTIELVGLHISRILC